MSHGTCRICHEYGRDVVKYAARHYAHPECAMKKWGADFFDRITPTQAATQIPVMIARDLGLFEILMKKAEPVLDAVRQVREETGINK